MAKEILCGFGIDVDAVAGWLGSYGGEDSPDDISRGMFAGEVGSLRLLKLFEKYGLKTTWFIPGHSIETFPEQMRKVVNELDRPGSEASIGRNIDMTMTFLKCSTKPASGASTLPADLEPVARQLRAATQYKDVEVWDVVPLRLQEGMLEIGQEVFRSA